ncbi:unnamed protein product [Trichogramma brassicae]|uniref:MYND-type domain-containing protein n=1 Tax=Trichogramma brassicae TaxID=86971 RepID=A0A6H5JBC5_9HYME|nr:unnamed protein product [Trichogramma brassicae]
MDTFVEDMMEFVGKLEEYGRERQKMALADRQLNETVCNEMDTVRKQMAESKFKSSEISVICRNFANFNNFLYRCTAAPKHDSKFHASCFEWAGHCLAYAQPGSMEHVLGLQTRANLHYHCGNWEECRRDATEALDLMDRYNFYDQTGTVKMLWKLVLKLVKPSLVSHFRNATGDPSMNMWRALNPRYLVPQVERPHRDPACLHEGVEPAYSLEWGRHLVAKRDIEVGEMVLVEDLACGVLVQNVAHTKCAHCLAQAWVGPACDKCVNAVYCSEKCKVEAWRDYHEVECELFQLMDDRDKEREVNVAALRLLIKSIKKEGLKKIIQIADIIDRNRGLCSVRYMNHFTRSFRYHPSTQRHRKQNIVTNFGLIYGLLDRANYNEEAEKFECYINKIRDGMDVEKEERQKDHMETDEFPDQQYDLVLKNVLRKCKSNDIDEDTMKAVRRIFNKLKEIFYVNNSYVCVI